jgi:hypothetical protein
LQGRLRRLLSCAVAEPLDRRWRGWLAKSWQDSARTIIVIVGLVLVAVPTAFGAFPYLVSLWITWRALIGLAWLAVAVVAVRLAAKSDDAVRDAVKAGNDRSLLAEHRNKLRDQLESLFVSGTGGLPDSYHLTPYGPSPDGQFLIPLYPPALGLADPAIGATRSGTLTTDSPPHRAVASGPTKRLPPLPSWGTRTSR